MKLKRRLKVIFLIVGPIAMAAAVNFIYEPSGMVTGGISGIAIILRKLTMPYVDGGINIGYINLFANIVLFILAAKAFGKKYVYSMIVSAVIFSVALFVIPTPETVNEDYFLAAVFGGGLTGMGLGMVFLAGSSTGGTDLIGALIHKHIKSLSTARILGVIDGAIVLMGLMVFGVKATFYSIIAIFITMKIMDGILSGFNYARMVYIISDKSELIAKQILSDMERGVTGLNTKGMYKGRDQQMLLCVVSPKELVKLIELIHKNDPKAFIIISDIREVVGEGFIESQQ